MAEAVEAESPTLVGNDELVENCLIMIQQLFAEEQISSTERDHLKGKKNFSRQRLYISLNSKGLDFFKLKCLLPFLSKLLYMWPVFIIFNL